MAELSASYRSTLSGTINSLLHARSSGHYIVPQTWRDHCQKKHFLELFWCVSGQLEFLHQNTSWVLSKNQLCFLFPGDIHHISALNKTEFYWLTIDGPNINSLIDSFRITRLPYDTVSCPTVLFERLAYNLHIIGNYGEYMAGAVAYEILSLAFAGIPLESNQLSQLFKKYIEQNFRNPQISIESCAKELQCHRSTLVRYIHRYCGISPMEFLLQRRMQEACQLLINTKKSIKEISTQCGFSDPNYFGKVIKKQFNKKPMELRG